MAVSDADKENQMQLALEACDAVESPKFTAIARQYPPVNRQTLRRRFLGMQTSKADAFSEVHQNLSTRTEDVLIEQINLLATHHIPLTPKVLQALVEEIIDRPVGKNWTVSFLQKHQSQIKCFHSSNRSRKRIKSEYASAI